MEKCYTSVKLVTSLHKSKEIPIVSSVVENVLKTLLEEFLFSSFCQNNIIFPPIMLGRGRMLKLHPDIRCWKFKTHRHCTSLCPRTHVRSVWHVMSSVVIHLARQLLSVCLRFGKTVLSGSDNHFVFTPRQGHEACVWWLICISARQG